MDYRELPEEFLDKMRRLLGETAFGEYAASFSEAPYYGLRVNGLKLSAGEFEEMVSWNLRPVPWIENGFYYEENKVRPSRHPYYAAGLYYLQEPSAMTPASLLPVAPGDCVLDLCAAPGGKSTELAAKLGGTGLLFSNDISNSRAKALLKNLELCGAGNICVSSETPEKLALCLEGFFDKILVDAPCSGEGMFRRDPDMVKSYREKGPESYRTIQCSIARAAVKMLKPGGLLLYSTCTFDEQEDEGVIRSLMDEFPQLCLVPLPRREGFEPGFGLEECVRLFPHRIQGEGHFIALMRKGGGGEADIGKKPAEAARFADAPVLNQPLTIKTKRREKSASFGRRASCRAAGPDCVSAGPDTDGLASVLRFLSQLNRDFETDRLYLKNGNVYYLPAPIASGRRDLLMNIRYLRTGLYLGEVKKGRFEPSQALAMALTKEEAQNILNLPPEGERVLRYLKGETIVFSEDETVPQDGWCLVCTGGFPLGWGKQSGRNLKNKYYPGWRWQ